MSFKLVDPPFGSQLIAPFFQSIQPLREAYNKAQLDEDCKNETSLLLMDVLLGVVSGSGSVEFMAGGTEAWTDDTDFSSHPSNPSRLSRSHLPPRPSPPWMRFLPPPIASSFPASTYRVAERTSASTEPGSCRTSFPRWSDLEAPPPVVKAKTKNRPGREGRGAACQHNDR